MKAKFVTFPGQVIGRAEVIKFLGQAGRRVVNPPGLETGASL